MAKEEMVRREGVFVCEREEAAGGAGPVDPGALSCSSGSDPPLAWHRSLILVPLAKEHPEVTGIFRAQPLLSSTGTFDI